MLVASLPLLRVYWDDFALTKDKNAVVALNNVNGGGNVSMNFLLILRSLERSIALMTSVDC